MVEIGAPDEGFAFDNERPRHPALLQPYRLASRLITNAEYLDFINDKGYLRPELWLSDGWDTSAAKHGARLSIGRRAVTSGANSACEA